MNIDKWLKKNTHSLKGNTILITGSTGGLGKEISFILAKLEATIIFANRNKEKSIDLINSIKVKYPNTNIRFLELDLSKPISINNFLKEIKNININIFIHNAGIYNVKNEIINDDIDNIFLVNFLAPYYISSKILTTFKQSNKPTIIATSSIAHNFSKIDENNITFINKSQSKKYGNSKRFLTYSLFELFKDSNMNLSIAHPGVTLTNMTNHYPKFINWFIKIMIKLVFPSPKKSCLSIIYAIFHPCDYHYWIGPSIFNIWGYPKVQKLKTANEEECKKISNIANKYCKKLEIIINETI